MTIFFFAEKMNIDQMREECNVMKELRHHHLVKLVAICEENDSLYIVLEFLQNGPLNKFLSEGKSQISR